jgi:hypothetical protein
MMAERNSMAHGQLVSLFLQFRRECIWLRTCYNTHSSLFKDGHETDQILSNVAFNFFLDLSRVLQEYCVQRICVLTDPPKSAGKPNLSVSAINQALEAFGLITPDICTISRELESYRNFIKPARDQLLSHLGQEAVLRGEPLGGHQPEEVDLFFENLQKYCDEVGTALGIGPLDFRVTSCKGDVVDLLRHLKISVAKK